MGTLKRPLVQRERPGRLPGVSDSFSQTPNVLNYQSGHSYTSVIYGVQLSKIQPWNRWVFLEKKFELPANRYIMIVGDVF